MSRYLTKATTINWDLQIEIEMCDHSPCWRRVVAGKIKSVLSTNIVPPLSSRPPVQLLECGGLCCHALSPGLRHCHAPAGPAGLTGCHGCHGCHVRWLPGVPHCRDTPRDY